MSMPEIVLYCDRPRQFWADMGYFFAHRDVRREMPYLIDDAGYLWFVAYEDARVVGFGAIHPIKEVGHLRGLYVLPERRREGIGRALIQRRLAYCQEQGWDAFTVASPGSTALLEACGFQRVGTRGKYAVLKWSR